MRKAVFDIHDEVQQLTFGETLAKSVDNKACVIFLQGDLGAGKTTLVRGFLHAKGHQDKVKSPTYTLVEEYEFPHCTVLHMDLYRLNHPDEVEQLSLRNYQNSHTIFIIEWPENTLEKLPLPDLVIKLQFHQNGRRLELTGMTLLGEEVIQRLEASA